MKIITINKNHMINKINYINININIGDQQDEVDKQKNFCDLFF